MVYTCKSKTLGRYCLPVRNKWGVIQARGAGGVSRGSAEMALHPQAKRFCHSMSSEQRTDVARCMVVVVITLPFGIADDVE